MTPRKPQRKSLGDLGFLAVDIFIDAGSGVDLDKPLVAYLLPADYRKLRRVVKRDPYGGFEPDPSPSDYPPTLTIPSGVFIAAVRLNPQSTRREYDTE